MKMALSEEEIDEYKTSLTDLNVNSKPLINMLTMLAEDHEQHAPEIVKVIEDHINKCKPPKKLPVLYLMDSIMKNLGQTNYKSLFAKNIVQTFSSVFEQVDEKTRASMFKLRQTWSSILPNQKLYLIDVKINSRMDPAWPVTAAPPETTSIHVNPKFLSKSGSSGSGSERSSPEVTVEEDEGTDEDEDQETKMRQQLIAKQKELIELQQARIKLELAEAEEKRRRKAKTKTTKASALPLPPEMDDPDPLLESQIQALRDSHHRSAELQPQPVSNIPEGSFPSTSVPLVNPMTVPYPGAVPTMGMPSYPGQVYPGPVNGVPYQPGMPPFMQRGHGGVFSGVVFPEDPKFSDSNDSDSSRSSIQDQRAVSTVAQPKVNVKDPRLRRQLEKQVKEAPNVKTEPVKDKSSELNRDPRRRSPKSVSAVHQDVHKDNRDSSRSSKDTQHSHSSKDHGGQSASRSPRKSSSDTHHSSKGRSASKDNDSKSIPKSKEMSELEKRKHDNERTKYDEKDGKGRKKEPSSRQADHRSKSKEKSPEKPKQQSSKTNVHKGSGDNSSGYKSARKSNNEDHKNRDRSRTSSSKTSSENQPVRQSSSVDLSASKTNVKVKVEPGVQTKQEANLGSKQIKREKRSEEREPEERASKKLKLAIPEHTSDENLVEMEDIKPKLEPQVSSDLSELFGSEDIDYRPVDQKGLPLQSPSSKGWDKFKASQPDQFAYDIELKKQRQDLDQRRTRQLSEASENQDIDLRLHGGKSGLDEDFTKTDIPDELSLSQHSEIIIQAQKQLREGRISQKQHQDLMHQVQELMQVQQKLQEETIKSENDSHEEDPTNLLSPNSSGSNVIPSASHASPREEPPRVPSNLDGPIPERETRSPERPMERFKIPKKTHDSASPSKPKRGLTELYPERINQEAWESGPPVLPREFSETFTKDEKRIDRPDVNAPPDLRESRRPPFDPRRPEDLRDRQGPNLGRNRHDNKTEPNDRHFRRGNSEDAGFEDLRNWGPEDERPHAFGRRDEMGSPHRDGPEGPRDPNERDPRKIPEGDRRDYRRDDRYPSSRYSDNREHPEDDKANWRKGPHRKDDRIRPGDGDLYAPRDDVPPFERGPHGRGRGEEPYDSQRERPEGPDFGPGPHRDRQGPHGPPPFERPHFGRSPGEPQDMDPNRPIDRPPDIPGGRIPDKFGPVGPGPDSERHHQPSWEMNRNRPTGPDMQGSKRTDLDRQGPPRPGFDRPGPPIEVGRQGGPREELDWHGPPKPDFERQGPSGFDRHVPPRPDFDRHGPPGPDFDRHGPPGQDFDRRGPPGPDFDGQGPPGQDFDRQGPPVRDFDRRGPPGTDFDRQGPPGQDFDRHGPAGQDFDRHGPPGTDFDRHGPPGPDFDRHGPPGPDFDRRGPPGQDFDRRGIPGPDFDRQGPPGQDFDRQGPPVRDFDRHGAPGPDFDGRGPPVSEFNRYGPEGPEFDRQRSPRQDFDRQRSPRQDFDRHGQAGQDFDRPGPQGPDFERYGPPSSEFDGPPGREFDRHTQYDGPESDRPASYRERMGRMRRGRGDRSGPYRQDVDDNGEGFEQQEHKKGRGPRSDIRDNPPDDRNKGRKRDGSRRDRNEDMNSDKRRRKTSPKDESEKPDKSKRMGKRVSSKESNEDESDQGKSKPDQKKESNKEMAKTKDGEKNKDNVENSAKNEKDSKKDGENAKGESEPFFDPNKGLPPWQPVKRAPKVKPEKKIREEKTRQKSPPRRKSPTRKRSPPRRKSPPRRRSPIKQEMEEQRINTDGIPSLLDQIEPNPPRKLPEGPPRKKRPVIPSQGKQFNPLPGDILGPFKDDEPADLLKGPPQQVMESYVDKYGDPRFRSFPDMGPEVSEEVVVGKRNYEIKLGAPPRKIQWGNGLIEVYADPIKRGILINNELVYRFGERVKEVTIRGKREKIFYHGKPLDIWIDGNYYEVRVDSPPKTLIINSQPHRIQVDGRDMMILIDKGEKGPYGGEPRFIFIDDNRMELRFDPPPRHILIDGEMCELKLNVRQPCINIKGILRGIRFQGPPRDILINDSRYQIFTDHAVKLRIGNRFHYVAFGGPCHELIVDGKWYEVKFDEPPKEINVGNRVLMVHIPGGPPEVKILEPVMQDPHNMPPMFNRGPQPMRMLGPGPPMVPGPPRPMMPPMMMRPPVSVPNSMGNPIIPPGFRPPMTAPTSVVPGLGNLIPGIQANQPNRMALPGMGQPQNMPSVLSSLFPTGPVGQAMAPAPVGGIDINSLLDKLVSTGIIKKEAEAKQQAALKAEKENKAKGEAAAPPANNITAASKNKVVQAEETFEEIPDKTTLDLKDLKVLHTGSIQRLYSGAQCNSCGARFSLDNEVKAEKYREHLDWHFRQNKLKKDDTKVTQCRKWFYGVGDWIQYEEVTDLEDQTKSVFFEQQQQGGDQSSNQPQTPQGSLLTVPDGMSVLKCPAATGSDNDDLCNICHEPFEQYWDEELEEWHLRDAIRVNEKTYHPICYEDYTDVSEGTPSPSVLLDKQPDFSSRKLLTYEESSQDGLPHSSFEEERNVPISDTKSNETKPLSIKTEPHDNTTQMVIKEERMDEPMETSVESGLVDTELSAVKQEPDSVSVFIKQEPSDSGVDTEGESLFTKSSSNSKGAIPGFDVSFESEEPMDTSEQGTESKTKSTSNIQESMETDAADGHTALNPVETISSMKSESPQDNGSENIHSPIAERQAEPTGVAVTEISEFTIDTDPAQSSHLHTSDSEHTSHSVEPDKLHMSHVGELDHPPMSHASPIESISDRNTLSAPVQQCSLSPLNRVKVAQPAEMIEISQEVLEISSNASTPTHDELPSPPSPGS